MIWFQQVFSDHTPKEQTHLYCKYRINILQTGNQFRSLVKRVPICLIARKQQLGFECDLWPFALSSLALLSCLLCTDEFWIQVKKNIEERNSANHNPSRPDRWLAMQISVSFMLLGRTRAKWACTLMKFIHPQTVELPDQLSNMVKSTVHVCVGQAISHIYTVKCDWQVSQSLTWLPSIAMGPNLEINTFFKKETFLFLSAQWAAVSTLT